ncbi:hypothetical protein LTR37_014641 [Vermiconidia calcicola]|uniref:Uncharacterized protein n=1 Tax=Vermiconidia calcicola TaxID=1690605 RepID=A0ACC3MUA0_9PEZI|nr:hypothetical protein LTR37_014641 [Vermiconidia calcicola]
MEKSRYETEDDDVNAQSLFAYARKIVLKPFDIVFSRTARRAYLTTFLAIFASLILLGLAVIAYTLFYWSYIPRIGFERTIHLQFDNVYHSSDSRYDTAGNPYGTVVLSPDVVSTQRYDVFVELTLPRTPDNRDSGNFMLEANMYAAGTVVDKVKDSILHGVADADNRLATSRRPAILSYRSWPVEYLYRLTELHWYILGWRNEAEKLTVGMWEGIEFARGWRNVPSSMRLDIQSTNRMQIYSAKAHFRARFGGLRWMMYNHRIISAVVFIIGFWMTEMTFAGLAWAALSFYMSSRSRHQKAEEARGDTQGIKQEDEEGRKADLSSTERTFATSSSQQRLRYESPQIKQEEEDEDAVVLPPETGNRATEADDEDEDEDADVFLDSGLGTSMESGPSRRDSIRRRRGRTRSEDGVK